MITEKSIALFHTKYEKSDGCWEWKACKSDKGYGVVAVRVPRKRNYVASRFMWEITNGAISSGLYVCHTCDNPGCVRPDHLFLGTQTDNMRDCSKKKRTGMGAKNGMAKITEDMVRKIRAFGKRPPCVNPLGRYGHGRVVPGSAKDIAIQFGISRQQVQRILDGKRWGHVD